MDSRDFHGWKATPIVAPIHLVDGFSTTNGPTINSKFAILHSLHVVLDEDIESLVTVIFSCAKAANDACRLVEYSTH